MSTNLMRLTMNPAIKERNVRLNVKKYQHTSTNANLTLAHHILHPKCQRQRTKDPLRSKVNLSVHERVVVVPSYQRKSSQRNPTLALVAEALSIRAVILNPPGQRTLLGPNPKPNTICGRTTYWITNQPRTLIDCQRQRSQRSIHASANKSGVQPMTLRRNPCMKIFQRSNTVNGRRHVESKALLGSKCTHSEISPDMILVQPRKSHTTALLCRCQPGRWRVLLVPSNKTASRNDRTCHQMLRVSTHLIYSISEAG